MTIDEDPKIETSPLSGRLTSEGVTVDVQIYRVAEADERWVLEVIDEQDTSTVWDDTFATDRDAYAEFYRTLESDGINSPVESPTLGTKH
jgi:hypothetical protein